MKKIDTNVTQTPRSSVSFLFSTGLTTSRKYEGKISTQTPRSSVSFLFSTELTTSRKYEGKISTQTPRSSVSFLFSTELTTSRKYEGKISTLISSYIAQVNCKSWLEWDLNAIQARMCSVTILLPRNIFRETWRENSNMISYTAQVKCKSWCEWNLNAIQARMPMYSITEKHLQRNMKRKF